MIVNIKPWVLQAAVEFLNEYADRLGNDVCNDYDVPEWMPLDELKAAIDALDPASPEGAEGYNWVVVQAVANAIDAELTRTRE